MILSIFSILFFPSISAIFALIVITPLTLTYFWIYLFFYDILKFESEVIDMKLIFFPYMDIENHNFPPSTVPSFHMVSFHFHLDKRKLILPPTLFFSFFWSMGGRSRSTWFSFQLFFFLLYWLVLWYIEPVNKPVITLVMCIVL